MSIHKKLALIFIAFSCVLIICMALLVKWSFQRSFTDYVQEQNRTRLQETALRLGDYYRQTGSWASLRDNPRLLRRLAGRSFHEQAQDTGEHHTKEEHPRKPKPPLRALFLLDANRQPVAGEHIDTASTRAAIPIEVDDVVVGYTGFKVGPRPFSMTDERFAKRQGEHLLLISVTAVILSLMFALPLSRFLVNRINLLGRQIRLLSEGQFDERITLSGHDELSQLANHLNHLALTLRQTEQSRRKWVADISHELRTPLATLRAQLEAIEDGVHQYNDATHTRLANQTHRLQQLVEDLYQLSLADVGALQYRKQNCNAVQLLDESIQPFKQRFEQAGLSLRCDFELDDNALLFADPQRIQQLFNNLLENSLRYTRAPGEIRIGALCEHSNLIITISDSAPGVPEPQLHRLFERFFRGESSRNRDTGGAGLGLNLCRTIVEAHEGTITACHSKLGGLEIIINVPMDCP